jgi:hypothetical protein
MSTLGNPEVLKLNLLGFDTRIAAAEDNCGIYISYWRIISKGNLGIEG